MLNVDDSCHQMLKKNVIKSLLHITKGNKASALVDYPLLMLELARHCN